jgi:DHA1 family tetracycline resistance protein-like MFS transporter
MAKQKTPKPEVAPEDKLDFKKLLPVFVIVLIDLLGMTIIIPLMPLYAVSFGANAFTIGLLGAAYPVMQFIGAPILGRLSDRYGRKPVLLISQLGTLAGFLVLGFASSLWMLFLSRIIDGISGANISTAQAAIADSTNEKNRTQGLGLLGAAFGMGFVIGPVIAFLSLLASSNNYHVPAFVAAAFSLISILLTWFWFEETLPEERRGTKQQKSAFSFGAMLEALMRPTIGFLFTLARMGLNASGNSIIFVFVGVIVVAVQGGFIGPWSRRLGERRLIYMGLALLAVGLTLTALTPRQPLPGYSQADLQAELSSSGSFRTHENPTTQDLAVELPPDNNNGWLGLAWILAAMVPVAVGGAVLQPSINSMITQKVIKEEVGGILGISAAFLSGANAIAPLIGGLIFQAFGARAPFLLGGLLMAVLWALALLRIKPETAEALPASAASSSG